MTPRVIADLWCPSEADALSVRDAVAQKLAAAPRVVDVTPPVIDPPKAPETIWRVRFDAGFVLRGDADDVFADVQNKWTSGPLRNRILAGSTVTFHVCAHATGGAGSGSCTSATAEWTERVK